MGKRSKQIRKANKKKKQVKNMNYNWEKTQTQTKKASIKATGFVSKTGCHTGQNLIFKTVDGIEVWAGGKNRKGGWQKMTPLPQLAIGPSETLVSWSASCKTDVPEGWSCEQHLENLTPPPTLSLDWPDYGIPKVNKYFWYAVIDDIREHNIKSISTQCAGGHGRTGVQLAILAYLLGTDEERAAWPDAGVLIDWVRDMHCTHAVEAKSQQEYIAEVCDIPYGVGKVSESSWSGGYDYPTNIGGGGKGKVVGGNDDFDGLYIDGQGADYCPHCEHIPAHMIINGELCPKCGENPQTPPTDDSEKTLEFVMDDGLPLLFDEDMASEVVDAVIKCPCCDSEDIHEESDICKVCCYNLDDEVTAYAIKKSCQTCGDMFAKHNMLKGHCFPCITQSNNLPKHHMKVKFDKKNRMSIRLICSTCHISKESRHTRSINNSKDGWECYACSAVRYAGLMKKDDSPSKTTPKEVKQ
jgi:hypothetical protein